MKKFIFLLLCGCTPTPAATTAEPSAPKEFTNYDEVCIKGVVYYRTVGHGGYSSLAPAWYQHPLSVTHYLRTCP